MIYAHPSDGDVYIIRTNGNYRCISCRLEYRETYFDSVLGTEHSRYTDFECSSILRMLLHLESHTIKGHKVSRRCVERLKDTLEEEESHIIRGEN